MARKSRLSDAELEACFRKSALPGLSLGATHYAKMEPAFDKNWLTRPVPILTIRGATELDRTSAAAMLARHWLTVSTQLFVPDDLRFYMADAVSAMDRYKSALVRRDVGYDDFDVLLRKCRFLTITEIGDLRDGDDVRFASVLRERRNADYMTVVTLDENRPLDDRVGDILFTGRVIAL